MITTLAMHDPDIVLLQASHHEVTSDHIYSVVGGHRPYHAALWTPAPPIDGVVYPVTIMPNAAIAYTTWWDSFNPHLAASAESHRTLANNLKTAVELHQKVDAHNAYILSGGTLPGPG